MQYDCSGTKFNKITDMIKHHLNFTDIDENHFAVFFHPLFEIIKEKLENQNLWGIYRDVDLPLIPWLFQMEKAGILTDEKQLQILNLSFTEKLNDLSKQIHAITGEDFNINSPAQLGVILFEQRGLAGGKKGPSGHWITDVKVLETLLEETNDELIRLILEYRSLNKLKSTYIDDLIERNKKDKRIHTSYSLTSTNTGRLSSSNPNLQNIPVRTQEGKNIRRVFVSKPGYSLISADYSQIELRLMADFANVQKLKDAFIKGDDIHAQTASQILSIPLNQVTPDQRRQAKAVNFGIIYGISSFGLARNLGISRSQAKQYIDAYFTQYPEIKTYMDKTIQFAQKNGFVKTPIGRRIYIDGFNIPAMRQFANRSAINAPIQGGAADIIKMAMIRVFKVLKESKLDITPLLQVHDELIFEVAEKDIESAKQIIKENMEKVIKLSIPLVAEIGVADNWLDAH
jgi:DNA polymerase-1